MSFNDTVLASDRTGSRVICNPPPTDTDDDYIILVNGYYDWRELLIDEGWVSSSKEEYPGAGDEFESFRKGEYNYIVTESPQFFSRYVLATAAAAALNLQDKADRIALFKAVKECWVDKGNGDRCLPDARKDKLILRWRP